MWLVRYLLVVGAYLALDGLNFGVLAKQLYASWYKDGFTNWKAAVPVYLLYPLCVRYLAQGDDWIEKAAVLGTSVYGIYHLTNMATLPQWSVTVALYDTLWGGLVTAILATLWHL
jgi:uncharacterized membrane protein